MPHRVLPASGGAGEIRKVLQDPAVDVLHRQRLAGRLFDGHVYEQGEGKRWLGLHGLSPVRSRRGAAGSAVVPLDVEQWTRARLGLGATQREVLEQVLVEPVEVGELLVSCAGAAVQAGGERTGGTLGFGQRPTNPAQARPLPQNTRGFCFLIRRHPDDWTH